MAQFTNTVQQPAVHSSDNAISAAEVSTNFSRAQAQARDASKNSAEGQAVLDTAMVKISPILAKSTRTSQQIGHLVRTQKRFEQTYKRDTGEVMHDLSVPILIGGKHWGGFRIGYFS